MNFTNKRIARWAVAALLAAVLAGGMIATGAQAQTAKAVTLQEMVATANGGITSIGLPQGKFYLESKTLFVDVREPEEFSKGHVPTAMNIPRGLLEFQITAKVPDKTTRMVVYCKSGARSALSTETLQRMGYTNVVNMSAGFDGWAAAGYAAE